MIQPRKVPSDRFRRQHACIESWYRYLRTPTSECRFGWFVRGIYTPLYWEQRKTYLSKILCRFPFSDVSKIPISSFFIIRTINEQLLGNLISNDAFPLILSSNGRFRGGYHIKVYNSVHLRFFVHTLDLAFGRHMFDESSLSLPQADLVPAS